MKVNIKDLTNVNSALYAKFQQLQDEQNHFYEKATRVCDLENCLLHFIHTEKLINMEEIDIAIDLLHNSNLTAKQIMEKIFTKP